MMHRNLDRRVEALVRLVVPAHLKEIDDIFELAMAETTTSWALDENGGWTRSSRNADGALLDDLQTVLMKRITSRKRAGAQR